jgi:hypothetical protein
MELLVKYINTHTIGYTFKIHTYEIYSTVKRDVDWLIKLLNLLESGQDISIKEQEINQSTSISFKFLYICKVSCDSSD